MTGACVFLPERLPFPQRRPHRALLLDVLFHGFHNIRQVYPHLSVFQQQFNFFVTPTHTNADSLDWQGLSAGEITERVVSRTKSGSILLFHNGAAHTPEALPNIITMLKNKGFRFVKLSELLLDGDYLLDSAGVQHPVEPEADDNASTPSEGTDGAESSAAPKRRVQL